MITVIQKWILRELNETFNKPSFSFNVLTKTFIEAIYSLIWLSLLPYTHKAEHSSKLIWINIWLGAVCTWQTTISTSTNLMESSMSHINQWPNAMQQCCDECWSLVNSRAHTPPAKLCAKMNEIVPPQNLCTQTIHPSNYEHRNCVCFQMNSVFLFACALSIGVGQLSPANHYASFRSIPHNLWNIHPDLVGNLNVRANRERKKP